MFEIKEGLLRKFKKIDEQWKAVVREKVTPIINLLVILKKLLENDSQIITVINNLNNLQAKKPEVKILKH